MIKSFLILNLVLISTITFAQEKTKPASTPVFDFDYEFGTPIKPNDMTYMKYRELHAEESSKRLNLPKDAIADGMDTWHWWVGVDNPGFWQDLVSLTGGAHNYTNLRIDFLKVLMTTPRSERFKKLGLINDPDTVASTKPDQFGLTLDRMKDGTLGWDPEIYGYSSGIIGIQLFKNKDFDPKNWSVQKYIEDGSKMQAPYKVGMSCVFCHIGFNPTNPPANPAEPKWENLTSTIGNQYLREGLIFGGDINKSSLIWQYFNTQEPGTSETSRFPTDSINNPTNINSIFRLIDRLKVAHVEKITPGQAAMIKDMYKNAGLALDNPGGALGGTAKNPTIKVPHILTDGADSLGILMASVRVYVNEGQMHKEWYDSWPVNPFNITRSIARGFRPQEFDIMNKWRKDPMTPWMQTERKMPNMATFLMSYDSFPLKDSKEGVKFLKNDEKILNRGKVAFAENCASCHSSKMPDSKITDPVARKKAWTDLVMQKDFLENNYLSDDQRYSVLELGTNAQRAQGTNALSGSTWGQMSSVTYKEQRSKKIEMKNLYNPLSGKYDLTWKGLNAFYRTPTLVSIWATAPYFHNNSLGLYNSDPTVKGRMEAYDDAMEKLLWPEKRLGVKSIKVTSTTISLPEVFPGLGEKLKGFEDMDLKLLELPAGTPVNLVMNVNPRHFASVAGAYIKGVLGGKPKKHFKSLIDTRRQAGIEAMKQRLLMVNTIPDFIEDKGHYYGSKLSNDDKMALIEYMKHF